MSSQEFLDNLNKLSSFNKKIQFADQNLKRLGSGSGRIVYDFGNGKVLKLARNNKGIAQNNEEINVSTDAYAPEVIAKVFDHHPEGWWIVAERGNKVTEKRIKEVTGIPSLNALNNYLLNMFKSGNWHIDYEIMSELDDNEWVQEITDFVGNWGQHTGDYGRPSTYGEVNRGGDPEIVITDYGLTDEVYSTYYQPNRNNRYRIHELIDMNRGGIYDEFSDGSEHRKAFWALQPYSVSDGQGVMNEEMIDFLENRTQPGVMRRPIFSLIGLAEEFNNVVGNLPKYNEKAKDHKLFYENLIKLQEYLKHKGLYDKELIQLDEVDIPVKKWTLSKEESDKLAKYLNDELNLGGLSYIGGGGNGYAYKYSGNKVLKITADPSEASSALKIQRAKPETTADVYNVYKISDQETNQGFFVILQEYIEDKPRDKFVKYNTLIAELADATGNKDHIGILKRAKRDFNYDEYLKKFDYVLNGQAPELNISDDLRKELYEYVIGLLNIQKDLSELRIKSDDYLSGDNLGYKNGKLVFFDVGGYRSEEPALSPQQHIEYTVDDLSEMIFNKLKEGDGALYSTQDSIGRLGYPPRNNVDQQPPIDNNLYANSAMYLDEDKKFAEKRVNEIYNLLKDKMNFTQLNYLGSGMFGDAYDVGNNMVMKITTDKSEAVENLELLRKDLDRIAKPYNVFKLTSKKANKELYVIVLEKLRTDPSIADHMSRLRYAFGSILDVNLYDIIDEFVYDASFGDYVENKEKIEKYLNKNPKDKELFNDLVEIAKEVKKLGVESTDFMNPDNLGYNKRGELSFFDLGFANPYKQSINKPEEYEISEKLNEEHIGHIDDEGKIEVFKNPKSIKRMKPDIRAVATKNGDLFVMDDSHNLIHNDLIKWLISLGYSIPINAYEHLDEVLPLQRYGNTNNFYLSESVYPDEINDNIIEIKKISEKTKQKNPSINIVIQSINALQEDRKKSYMPQSKTVKVKDKCKLGGLNGKSAACNQGDINNLEFGSINENVKLDSEIKLDGWNSYKILHDENIAGEVEITTKQDSKYLKLNKIFINPEHRGMGHADDVLRILTDYADKNNKIITLTPDNIWGASKEKLKKWYKSWDFVMNTGKNKDFQTRELMYRLPKGSLNLEGVGDKYLEKKHGFKPEFSSFEDDYKSYRNIEDKQQIIRTEHAGNIIKNPTSLENIGPDVRGVIDKRGNLYLEENGSVIHERILQELTDRNQIKYQNLWHLKLPEDFITIQRVGNTNDFVLGESNEQMRPEFARSRGFTIKPPPRKEAKPIYQKFIDLANKRFPFADFKNELYMYYDQPEGFADELDNELNESLISSSDSIYKDKTPEEIKEHIDQLDNYIDMVNNKNYLSQEDAEEILFLYKIINYNKSKYVEIRGYEKTRDDLDFTLKILRKFYPLSFKGGLNENKKSNYTKTKESLMRSKKISNEMKDKIVKYLSSGSRYENGIVLGLLIPKVNGKSFNGVSLGADKDGFFVYTHRASGERFESPENISKKSIEFIESTG